MGDRIDLESEDLASLRQRRGVKWARDPDKIACWVADMDFPIAPPIVQALKSVIDSNDLGYPSPALEVSLISAFARWSKSRHGLDIDPDSVVMTTDVVQAIYLALMTLTEPGDGVLVLMPAYPPYFPALSETGRRLVAYDLTLEEGRYSFDPDALRRLVADERPRALLLCNPHNPTGRAFTDTELGVLAELAEEFDLLVISDEIHCDLVFPGATHRAIATLGSEIAARTITLSSASKTFSLAGMRCALAACGSGHFAERMQSVPARVRGAVNVLGMTAAIAAWEEGEPWLEEALSYMLRNRDRLVEFFSGYDTVTFVPPEATYLGWVDLSRAGLGDDPAEVIADRADVLLVSGPAFGTSGRGHARFNFATTAAVLEEALGRIGKLLSTASG